MRTEIFRVGLDTFGDKERFRRWLIKPNFALGGLSPESLLNTSEGLQEVLNVLHRIEYGNLA